MEYEHGLNAAIKRLRELIGDSATSPTYIETLPCRGNSKNEKQSEYNQYRSIH